MKPTLALKPLAFALAALMAVAAQAHDGTLDVKVTDVQNNHGNKVLNQGTENNSSANDSLGGYSGVVGANIQSGDNNQGANGVAIGTAGRDAQQVFASVNVGQSNGGNQVLNAGSTNNASANNSGNGGSGIAGVNISSGTSNQGKNDVALASGDGRTGGASTNTVQDVSGNLTLNVSTGHGWNTTAVTNNSSANSSFNRSSGVVGVNIQSGSGNQGSSSVAITKF